MARKDDFKIKIQAEFEDNTIGGLKKTQENLKQLGKGIKETQQDVKSLDDAKAEPTLSCRDELTKEVERTQRELNSIDKSDVDATVSLDDKATTGIEALNRKVGDFDKSNATATIGVNDKATNVIESATESGLDFQNHPFMTSMGIVDKATTVIENIDGRAKTLAAKAVNITIGAIDKATEPLRNVYNWLTSIQGIVTTMVAGEGFNKLFAEPVKTADFFATSQIGFETMLGSEQAAIDMMKQINDFAIETPFNTSSLVETTQKMIAMGWAAEDVINDLDTIGDAMAAMGKGEEGVSAVTLALSQMRAAGKVNAQDMMQLVNVGLPAWQYLADGMGKTVAEVRDMASAGQITANDAIPKILQGMQQFDGMMDRTANETVSGLFSQLQDIAEINIMQPWGKGLSEGVRPALVEINNILGEVLGNGSTIGETLQGWGKSLGGTVANGLTSFAENIYKVMNNPEFNSMTWAEKTSVLLDEGIVKPISAWWDKSGKKTTTDLAKNMMKALGNGIKELLPVVLEAAFSNPVTGTMVAAWGLKTGTNFLGGIMSGLSGAKTAVNSTVSVLKGLSNIKTVGFTGFASAVKEAGSLSEALRKIGEISKTTSEGMETLEVSTELISDVFKKAYKESGSLTSALKMAQQTTSALSSGAVTASVGMETLENSTELVSDVFKKAYKESGSLTASMKMANETASALSSGAITTSTSAGKLTEAFKSVGQVSKVTKNGMAEVSNSAELISDVFRKAYNESGSLTSAMKMANETTEALSTGTITASTATGGLVSSLGSLVPVAMGVVAALGTLGASYLHYQNMRNSAIEGIQEELTKSDELIAKNQEVNSSIAENIKSREQDMASITVNSETAKQFTEQLFAQIDAQNKTADSQAQIAAYVDNLNQLYPQLGLNYDSTTGKLLDQNGALISNKEALEGRIDALSREAKQEAARSQLVEAYKNQIEAEMQLKELEQQRTDLENQRAEALNRVAESQNNAKNGTDAYSVATRDAGIQAAELKKQIEEVNGQINNANGTLKTSETEIGNLTAIASGSGEQISQTASQTSTNVNNSLNSTASNATSAGQQTGANYAGGLSSQEAAVRSSAQETFGYVKTEADNVKNTMNSKGSDAGSSWMSGFKSAFSGVSSWFSGIISGFNTQLDTVKTRTAEYEAQNPKKHAQGGIMSTPHLGLVAEDGPEAIIPLSGSKKGRGLELWQEAGKRLGVQMYAEGGITPGSAESQGSPAEESTSQVSFNIGVSESLDSDYADAMTKSNEFANEVNVTNQQMAANAEVLWSALGNAVTNQLGAIEDSIVNSNNTALTNENSFWVALNDLVTANFTSLAANVINQNDSILNSANATNGSVQGGYFSLINNLINANANYQGQNDAFLNYIFTQGTTTFSNLATQITNSYSGINGASETFRAQFQSFLDQVYSSGTTTFSRFANETANTFNNLITTVSTPLKTIESSFNSFQENLVTTGLQTFTDYVNNAKAKLSEAERAIESSLQNMVNTLESQKQNFYNKGSELMGQVKSGMDSKKAELESGTLTLAEAIKKKFEEGMGIASPSKWGIWAGSMIPEGLIKGMSGDKLKKFVSTMVGDVQNAWDKGRFDANKLVNYLSEDTVIKLMGKLTGLDTSAVSEQQIAYPLIGTRGVQTSWFGPRESPGGIGSTNHGGVDLAAPTGTPIAAALAGNVTTASWYGGYGNAVVVDSGDIDIIYGHMSKIGASVGQQVSKGQQIGLVGSTGNSTGPHLHFEMHQNGQRINPQPYIEGASITATGGNPLVNAIQNALNIKKGIATVSSTIGSVAYNPSAGVEQWRSTVLQALSMLGQPASEVDNILYIIDKESSGNPNPPDCLDSNYYAGYPSKGLMQTIPQTFNAYRNPSLSANILDPLANIYAGINYMISRYGSIDQTIAKRRSANGRWNGYAQGTSSATEGYHWVGERGKELVYFGGGETVFPNSESKKIEEIAQAGESAQGSSKQIVFQNGSITFNITTSGNTSTDMFNNFIQQVQVNAEQIAGIIADKVMDRSEGTPMNGAFA